MAKKTALRKMTSNEVPASGLSSTEKQELEATATTETGADDKDAAIAGNTPRIKVVDPEGADWLNRDPFGLKRAGLYGKRNSFALRYSDLERHQQFRAGNGEGPMGPTELEVLHGQDTTAPENVVCPICTEPVTSFVRTAMVDRETGDLVRDNGVVRYRGQFVAVGPDALNLTVHGAHAGDCLYQLRVKRDRNGRTVREDYQDKRGNSRSRVVLLPSHSFDQANARAEGVKANIRAKREERKAQGDAVRGRLGFKIGEAVDVQEAQPRGNHRSAKRQRSWA